MAGRLGRQPFAQRARKLVQPRESALVALERIPALYTRITIYGGGLSKLGSLVGSCALLLLGNLKKGRKRDSITLRISPRGSAQGFG